MTSPTKPKTKKIVLGPNRKVVAFRMNETVSDKLTTRAKSLGLTTCQVIEGIATAFNEGTAFIINRKTKDNPKTVCLQLPWICNTINANIFREVGKVRRHKYNELPERQVNPYLNFDVPCGETAQDPRKFSD